MKILVIGGGGREHALGWKLAQSPRVDQVFMAPGNGGTAAESALTNIPARSVQECLGFALENQIDLTVVGPEAPLAEGVVDLFRENGLKIFGPTRAAAQLESSKTFAKDFMKRHGIPTAAYAAFTSEQKQEAHDFADQQNLPLVIKADGLAAGKGVIIAQTIDEAHQTIDDVLGGQFGSAGARIVIEEFLEGEEASFIVLADNKSVLPLASSQDHKRLLDGDKGPNTGGMGAYSPAPIVTPALQQRIMAEIIQPVIDGLRKESIEYTGFLYAGLMIGPGSDADRAIKVLEFNCRMGDPETQPIMMRLQSDLAEVVNAAIEQKLDQTQLKWDPRSAVGVVIAAPGYPEKPRTGEPIELPENTNECVTFHAGTRVEGDQTITSGGRIVCVTALGDSVESARDLAYHQVKRVKLADAQYRSDIAWRALSSHSQQP